MVPKISGGTFSKETVPAAAVSMTTGIADAWLGALLAKIRPYKTPAPKR